MKRTFSWSPVIALAGLVILTPAAQAAPLTWDWSWTGPPNGSGTLTTNPESGGSFLITAMMGTFNGGTVTLLAPAGI